MTPQPPPLKTNPLKLNKLQLRTLALAQVLAQTPGLAHVDEKTGAVTLSRLPRPHGDHVHIGAFTVSARDISGFSNPAVWTALRRKGLVLAGDPPPVTLTREGVAYETGLSQHFPAPPGH